MATQLSTLATAANIQTPSTLDQPSKSSFENLKSICELTFEDSVAGRANFPMVVEQLSSAGIVRYDVNLNNKKKTYVPLAGDSIHSDIHLVLQDVNTTFDTLKIVNTIQRAQKGEINYVTFLKEIIDAGCASYSADFVGKFVEYKNIDGSQSHLEHFPRPK
jgi:uncharacterized protein YbcV (DUF1398 family)